MYSKFIYLLCLFKVELQIFFCSTIYHADLTQWIAQYLYLSFKQPKH